MYKNCFIFLLLFTIAGSLPAQGVKQLWMGMSGGKYGKGTVASLDGQGNNLNTYFDFKTIDKIKFADLNGSYFGVSAYGIFEWNPTGNTYERRTPWVPDYYQYFFDGPSPSGDLSAYNGKCYGISNQNMGVIYEWDPRTNIVINKINFIDNEAAYPWGNLTLVNGKFYGLYAGVSQGGIFEWDPETNIFVVRKRLNFLNIPLNFQKVSLTYYQQKFYGFDYWESSIFEWDPLTNDLIVMHKLTNDEGQLPVGNFAILNDRFYGVATEGGMNGKGTLFAWDPATNVCEVQHTFDGTTGEKPTEGLTPVNNKLYGATTLGGDYNLGVLFEWDPDVLLFTVKQSFNGTDGAKPWNLFDVKGDVLLGVMGGEGEGGIIFEFNTVTETLVKRVDCGNNYANPTFLSVFNGKIYGTATAGGRNNAGGIFEFDPQNMLTPVIQKFDFGAALGYSPNAPLVEMNGRLYGSTTRGGTYNRGTLFQWDPETNNYEKKIDSDVAFQEMGGLTPHSGKFYFALNAQTEGDIFEWDPVANQLTKKLSISRAMGSNYIGSFSSLTLKDDTFFGVIGNGGSSFMGLIYEWNPITNIYTKKIEFDGINGIHRSYNGLTLMNGKFYGTTSGGGMQDGGVIFEWDPTSNVYVKKLDFAADISQSVGNLVESGNKLYGATLAGGASTMGVIFEWDPSTNTLITKSGLNVDHYITSGFAANWTGLTAFPAQIAGTPSGECKNFPSIGIDSTNSNQWVPVTGSNGDVLAEIQPHGNNLGVTNAQVYINNGGIRSDGAGRPYLNRSITLTPTTQPSEGNPVDIRLYITKSEFDLLKASPQSGISDISDIAIFKSSEACSGGVVSASPIPTTYEDYAFGYVLKATITSFSTFYFSNRTFEALPLQMLAFTGTLKNDDVLLQWTTDHEYNTRDFDIERSTDGSHFILAGNIPAFNNAGTHKYNFTDKKVTTLPSGILYYRLKQKDVDGKYEYSKTISVDLPVEKIFILSPNPAQNFLNILYRRQDAANNAILQITDMGGKKVLEQIINPATVVNRINITMLSKGVYMISILNNGERATGKFVKQ